MQLGGRVLQAWSWWKYKSMEGGGDAARSTVKCLYYVRSALLDQAAVPSRPTSCILNCGLKWTLSLWPCLCQSLVSVEHFLKTQQLRYSLILLPSPPSILDPRSLWLSQGVADWTRHFLLFRTDLDGKESGTSWPWASYLQLRI